MRAVKIISLAILVAGLCYLGFKTLSNKKSGYSEIAGFDDIAYFNALRDENFSLPGQQILDVDTLIKIIPEKVSVKYESVNFDSRSGATIVSGIKISMVDKPEVGINIGSLSLWEFDGEALSARFSGGRLDEVLPISKRIEATDLSMYGLETIFAPMMEAANEISIGMVEGMVSNSDPTLSESIRSQSLDKYEFKIGKLILSDLTLHTWELELSQAPKYMTDFDGGFDNNSDEENWHMAQKMMAGYHAVSFSDFSAYNTDLGMELTQDEMPMVLSISNKHLGYKNYDRGDLDFGIVRDTKFDMNMSIADKRGITGKNINQKFHIEGRYGLYGFENIRAAKVFKHLAIGKMPDRTDTDFMSFGVWRFEDIAFGMEGGDLYSLEKMKVDLSEFHWLIPEVIDIKIDNLVYNLKGFMAFLNETTEDFESYPSDEDMKLITDVLEVLEKYELIAPSFDFQLALHWNAETGKSDFKYALGLDDFSRFSMDMDVIYPDYETISSNFPDKAGRSSATNAESIDDWLSEFMSFVGFEMKLTDEGGFEKGFAMAVDFAQLAPDDDPGMDMLRNSTPEILRNMASNGILVALVEVDKSFPPGVAYLQSLSKFIGEGGTLTMAARPEKPLSAAEFEELEVEMETNPMVTVEKLGLSVVHTPAQ